MIPVELRTVRLVLDQPTIDDAARVTEYCQDPVFEQFMSTPWPYRRRDAEKFLETIVPANWATDREFTWALRREGEFLGLVGFRTANRDLGFWLGAPFRGNRYMPEAVAAVLDWAFAASDEDVYWECYPGNVASASVARSCGFTYRGEGIALIPSRDGTHPLALTATISKTDTRDPKPGWPG